jgi:hypothetical protein
LLAEGRSVVYVASQAGYAPSMKLDTYAHVIEELETGEHLPAEGVISSRTTDGGSPHRPSRSRSYGDSFVEARERSVDVLGRPVAATVRRSSGSRRRQRC